MFFYMFGMDAASPERCAKMLSRKGFTAVVCPADQRCIEAVRENGMQAFACVGAFPLQDGGQKCLDIDDHVRIWFSSGCPNDPDAQLRREERWRATARIPGLTGLFIDGARFASPASPEGPEALFTCFCPHCRAQMETDGMDAEAILRGVREWRDGMRLLPPKEWLEFRQKTVDREMRRFTRCVRELRPDLLAGAFVFPASLGALVGQTPSVCADMDIWSPMLYRRYAESQGPATLNHEYTALLRLIGAERTRMLTGVDVPSDVLTCGFSPEHLRTELTAVRIDARLAPILQLDDPCLAESIAAVSAGGAEGVGFFQYDSAQLVSLPELHCFG